MGDVDQYFAEQMKSASFRAALGWVELGEALCKEREAFGLSVSQLAKRLGTDRKTVLLMEEDPEQVPPALVTKAVALFEAMTDEFVASMPTSSTSRDRVPIRSMFAAARSPSLNLPIGTQP